MNILIIGSDSTNERIRGFIPPREWVIFHVPSIHSAIGWVTAYHADVAVFEEDLILHKPETTIEEFYGVAFSRCVVPCVVSDSSGMWGRESYGTVNAWRFSLDRDKKQFLDFLDFLSMNEPLPPIRGSLTGVLPPAGIRQIMPIIGAGRRSGRVVVSNGKDPGTQHILWIRQGDLVLSNSKTSEKSDLLDRLDELSSGWFCFVEAPIDDELIDKAREWYGSIHDADTLDREDWDSSGSTNLRQRFRETIASARSLSEIESILKSFLEMGIDKAAEHEDIVLMDKLADLSILLEKNELGKAIHLLRELREESTS